jgi:hypothetical protein
MLGSVATSPLPFQRIPMAWNRAFGGEVKRAWTTQKIDGETMIVPGHSSHFPANPEGMGFYLTADDAVEQPLPVLEDPAHRIEKVDDWPEPRCFAPYAMWGALRAQLVLKPDGKEIEKKDIPRITTRAVPLLTFDRIAPGTRITLAGMRPDGADLAFTVPEPPVALRVAIGPDLAHVEPTLDSVDIDAEAQTARFVYRAPFAYDLVKREQRRIDVEPTAALELSGVLPEREAVHARPLGFIHESRQYVGCTRWPRPVRRSPPSVPPHGRQRTASISPRNPWHPTSQNEPSASSTQSSPPRVGPRYSSTRASSCRNQPHRSPVAFEQRRLRSRRSNGRGRRYFLRCYGTRLRRRAKQKSG